MTVRIAPYSLSDRKAVQSGIISHGSWKGVRKGNEVILCRKKALSLSLYSHTTLPSEQWEYFQLQITENYIGPRQTGLNKLMIYWLT